MKLDSFLNREFLSAWVKTKRFGVSKYNQDVWDDLYTYCAGGPL